MLTLGKAQAILGGYQGHSEIKLLSCSNRHCIVSPFSRKISVPNGLFLAIPIPDTISGCITGGK